MFNTGLKLIISIKKHFIKDLQIFYRLSAQRQRQHHIIKLYYSVLLNARSIFHSFHPSHMHSEANRRFNTLLSRINALSFF